MTALVRKRLIRWLGGVEPFDRSRQMFRGEPVHLTDLVGEGGQLIANRAFVGCDLTGPAVIALGSGLEMIGVDLGGSFDNLFISTTDDRPKLGVLMLKNVIIHGGSIRQLSFIGSPEAVEAARIQLGHPLPAPRHAI